MRSHEMNRIKQMVQTAGVATAMMVGSSALASMIVDRTTAYGHGADAHVHDGNSTTTRNNNFGASVGLSSNNNGNNSARPVYLRFDISGITNGDISAADLMLTLASTTANSSFTLWGLVDGTNADRIPTGSASTGGWVEGNKAGATATGDEIRWSGRPASPSTSATPTLTTNSLSPTGTPSAYAVELGTFSWGATAPTVGTTISIGANPSSGLTVSSGLAADLLAFLQADTNGVVSFVITRPSSNGSLLSFHSKENLAGAESTNNPLFNPTLSMSIIPEPGSLALLAAGALMLLPQRRSGRA